MHKAEIIYASNTLDVGQIGLDFDSMPASNTFTPLSYSLSFKSKRRKKETEKSDF